MAVAISGRTRSCTKEESDNHAAPTHEEETQPPRAMTRGQAFEQLRTIAEFGVPMKQGARRSFTGVRIQWSLGTPPHFVAKHDSPTLPETTGCWTAQFDRSNRRVFEYPATVTVHTSLGGWSIFRREDAVNHYAPDRKHGPVPLARPRGTVPGERLPRDDTELRSTSASFSSMRRRASGLAFFLGSRRSFDWYAADELKANLPIAP